MSETFESGIFVISLDFELHWGVSETKTVEEYKENLENTRTAIRQMLELFKNYNIHTTWATVGFLFCKNKSEIIEKTERIDKPEYKNKKLSNYCLIKDIGNDYMTDPFHFGNDVISSIKKYPNQEIATHTFSHYYCLEEGPVLKNFEDDLNLALSTAKEQNIIISSIVFPRNQYSEQHLKICLEKGIKTYRGNSSGWLYKTSSSKEQHLLRRAARLGDSYLNLSGNNSSFLEESYFGMYNVPASRFLRPFNKKLKFLEKLRLIRLKKEMTYAAKNNKLYHLWWHPHNFGKNVSENIAFLKSILEHYLILKNIYGFDSLNMSEVPFYKKTYNETRGKSKTSSY